MQKFLQLLIVWIIPGFGGLVVYLVRRADNDVAGPTGWSPNHEIPSIGQSNIGDVYGGNIEFGDGHSHGGGSGDGN